MLILKINFYKFYKSFLGGAAVVENCDIKTVHSLQVYTPYSGSSEFWCEDFQTKGEKLILDVNDFE